MIKFAVSTIFAVALAFGVAGAQTDTRISATWQVVRYDLSVTAPSNEASRDITVKASLDLRNVSGKPAPTISLRLSSDAAVENVTVNGTKVDFTKAEEKLGTISLQRIGLRVPAVATGGSAAVTLDYKLAVNENSGVSKITPGSLQFLPMSFWYPTPNSWFFARGADYAPVKIIVRAPGLTTVSSGIGTGNAFDQKLLVQPFFVAGRWDEVTHSGVQVLLPKGSGSEEKERAAELAAIANDAKAYYSGLLGPATDTPIRIIAVRRGSGFHSGGAIMVDEAAFRRAKIDSNTALNISEAIAKLWFGDSLQVSGDGYGVIREGLPRFLANRFLEEKFGKDVANMERTRQRIAYAAVARRDAPLNLVAPLDDFYFPAVANKGAMVWRLLARKVGDKEFFDTIKTNSRSGTIQLMDLRAAFSAHKPFLDQMFDQVTDGNLLAGLPQTTGGETKIALRNTGAIDVTVDVVAFTENGEKLSAPATIRAASFGEVIFRSPSKITRVEIDPDKLYPQTDYSDDVAPRETTDSDLLLAVKRDFDRQAYTEAEATARKILRFHPRFDDVRVLLGRSLLAQNKLSDAESEFRLVLNEMLPTARSMAWAAVGIAEVAARTGRNDEALRFADQAIRADGEYGAGLAARAIRQKLNRPSAADESIKAFFAQFDRAAVSNRKAELDAMILSGEIPRFSGGISGQATEWRTTVTHVDPVSADSVLVETQLAVRLLTREPESGTAVYRLTRSGSGWKLSGVEIFEVR